MPKFDVLAIHQRQIERVGGLDGIRDEGLLDSALAQPQATFFGEFLHPTIHHGAAAYLYHLAKNHPFLDGNKCTAFATTIAFLWMNGYELEMIERPNRKKAIAAYLQEQAARETEKEATKL